MEEFMILVLYFSISLYLLSFVYAFYLSSTLMGIQFSCVFNLCVQKRLLYYEHILKT